MKVKKFEAATMPEAMVQVKKEMGKDAVILNSKVVYRGGILGMFKKKNFEVIAAIDPAAKEPPYPESRKMEAEQTPIQPERYQAYTQTSADPVMKEIQALKKLVVKQQTTLRPGYPSYYQDLYDCLMEQEVESGIAAASVSDLMEYLKEPPSSLEGAKTHFVQRLINRLPDVSFGGIDYEKKYIHLVGPTGVGKTTTLAKIAAQAVLTAGKKVAFITTDTYRIAAIDQLKTYAKILDVPIEVAYSIDDYMKARTKFQDYDLVLVDTAGRNFRNPHYVHELRKMIDFKTNMETYLVLSLTSRYNDMQEIYEQFREIPIKKLIFTKADEASVYGSALNMVLQNQLGVAYMTNGQNVPDDITEASLELLADQIVGERSHV